MNGKDTQTSLYFGGGIIGLLLTVLLVSPDTYTAEAGPLLFDAYYAGLYGFLTMVVFALYHGYTDKSE